MSDSKSAKISIFRLAVKLLVALVLVAGPFAKTASASLAAQSDAIGHHAQLQVNDSHADHHSSAPSPDVQVDESVATSEQIIADNSATSEKCCDLFCTSSGIVTPAFDLSTVAPDTLKHAVMNSDIAAGEWTTPHRPPNP